MIQHIENINLVLPWEKCEYSFEEELKKELAPDHELFGVEAVAVARRVDSDDVLFFLPKHEKPFAVVHLTWSGRHEKNTAFPQTRFFISLDDWVANCLKPDHRDCKN